MIEEFDEGKCRVNPDTEKPIKISWSQIRTFEECKQKAMLQRSGKRNSAKDIRAFFRGTVVDRVMRNWLEDPQPGQMESMVRSTLDFEETEAIESGDGVVHWRHSTDREDTIAWCVRLVTNLEPALNALALPFDYEPAKRFKVPVSVPYIDGSPTWIFLTGEMDLLCRNPSTGKFAVWDLKGTEDNNYWRKVVGQLIFYDIVTQAMFGQYAERCGLLQPLCAVPVLHWTFNENDYQQMWQRIIRYAQAIWQRDNAPIVDSKPCDWCPYKFACSKFKPVQQAGRKVMIGLQGKQHDILNSEEV